MVNRIFTVIPSPNILTPTPLMLNTPHCGTPPPLILNTPHCPIVVFYRILGIFNTRGKGGGRVLTLGEGVNLSLLDSGSHYHTPSMIALLMWILGAAISQHMP